MLDARAMENAGRATAQYDLLEQVEALTDAQEEALGRGDLFLATLLAEMTPAPVRDIVTQVSPLNALWASAIQEHAVEVRGRVQYALRQMQQPVERRPQPRYTAQPIARRGHSWSA